MNQMGNIQGFFISHLTYDTDVNICQHEILEIEIFELGYMDVPRCVELKTIKEERNYQTHDPLKFMHFFGQFFQLLET